MAFTRENIDRNYYTVEDIMGLLVSLNKELSK